MSNSVGQIALDLTVNQKQFEKQMTGIQSTAKKVAATLVAAFSTKKIIEFGKSCIELGSNLSEVQNVVDVTFPKMAAQVDEFAKSAASSFGLSETMAKKYTGTFGAMAKAFGFTEEQAYDMSTTLTGLAGDVASFYNITQDEAYTKLKSVFTGETETLKELGIVMTQNALDSYAMANGYGKVTAKMSEAEKVALRYAFVQDQLAAATGDFSRTSGSWANQVRLLNLQFESLKATIGQGLINVFLPVLRMINSLLGKLNSLASAFKSFSELITGNKAGGGSGLQNTAGDLANASGEADRLADSTAGIGEAAKKAAKELNLMAFDKIQKVQSQDSSGFGNSGTSIGGSVDYGSIAQGETAVDQLDGKFSKMFENIQRNMQPTIDSLKRLWNEGLAKFKDFTWVQLKNFYKDFLVPVGKWTFGEGIPRFVNAINDGLMNIDYEKIEDECEKLWNALTPFSINIGEGLLWFWENVLVPLGTWSCNEVVPRFLETLSIAINITNNVLTALQPLFQWFWDSVLQPLANWAGDIFLTAWDAINDALKRFSDWCEKNPGTIQTIATILVSFAAAWKIVNGAITIFNTLMSIASNGPKVIDLLNSAIASLTSPIGIAIAAITAIIAVGILLYKNWDTISEKAKEVWSFVQKKFEDFGNFVTNVFQKDWSDSFGAFGEVMNAFLKNVSNIWEGSKKIFQGIVDFVTGIFTGNWKKAWNSVKDIFVGAFKLMVSLIKTPINGIIGVINVLVMGITTGINAAIRALNNLSFDVPDWVPAIGGKKFGFNLKTITATQIPYLANGGFVKANTPRLAVIGDNKTQGEIVAPEGKLQAMVDQAVRRAGGNISKEELERIINSAVMRLVAALASMSFNIDGEELATAETRAKEGIDRRYNPVKVT